MLESNFLSRKVLESRFHHTNKVSQIFLTYIKILILLSITYSLITKLLRNRLIMILKYT